MFPYISTSAARPPLDQQFYITTTDTLTTMNLDTGSELQVRDEETFCNIERYPWDSDTEFLQGLTKILSSRSDKESALDLTLEARCYYFSRQGSSPAC